MAKQERKLYKEWFDRYAAGALAGQVQAVYPELDADAFIDQAVNGIDALEFAARVKQFSDALAAVLPKDIPKALRILSISLPAPLPDCEAVTDGWLQWPVGQYIADYGVPYFDDAMQAMIALTQRFSSEFAVRPYVEHYPGPTLARLQELTVHPSPHVRRWCSEGIRPRLPWGKRLTELVRDPSPIFPILEKLKDDTELYVRRSVANNLNDISKDHPEAVVAICKKWQTKGHAQRRWVIRQALRSLIKEGHSGALELMGYGPPVQIAAKLAVHPDQVAIGETIELKAHLHNQSMDGQVLLLDYAVHYVRANGSAAPKVFKWKEVSLPSGAAISLKKEHAFRVTTVRKLYPGAHKIELQVNGVRLAETRCQLA